MATTYQLISSVTVGSGGASSIDFTSIPATYTDLKVVFSFRTNNSDSRIKTTFNNSSSNYSERMLYSNQSNAPESASRTGQSSFLWIYADGSTNTASTFNNGELYIPNYAGSNNKSASLDNTNEQNGTTDQLMNLNALLWSNTTAINQITFTPNAGSFVQYSTAYLYGIKNS